MNSIFEQIYTRCFFLFLEELNKTIGLEGSTGPLEDSKFS